jgi:hypothetical protein
MNNQKNDTVLRVLTLLMLALTLFMCISVFSPKHSSAIEPIKHPVTAVTKSQFKPTSNIEVPLKFYTEPNINYSTEKNIFDTVHKVRA